MRNGPLWRLLPRSTSERSLLINWLVPHESFVYDSQLMACHAGQLSHRNLRRQGSSAGCRTRRLSERARQSEGPPHGLPISLEDQIPIKDLETTMGIGLHSGVRLNTPLKLESTGYATWVGNYAEDHAILVKLLLQAGAAPFVKTNLPQTIMVRSCPHAHGPVFTTPSS